MWVRCEGKVWVSSKEQVRCERGDEGNRGEVLMGPASFLDGACLPPEWCLPPSGIMVTVGLPSSHLSDSPWQSRQLA